MPRHLISSAYLVLALALAATPAGAQPSAPTEPVLGQKGKDVQWVPSPAPLVEKMLDMAQVTPKDFVVDLGSGDGVLVIAAARRGVRAMGIEYDGNLVDVSRRNAREAGVERLTRFVKGDIFKKDFSKATVVTTFLLPSLNLQLRPTLLAMKPGTRVVSNTFPMGEWEPDDRVRMEGPCERWCEALFWIVPARVGGSWRTPQGELALTQRFQFVSGTLGKDPIENGRLRGAEISFTAGGAAYVGRVDGPRITGTREVDGRRTNWSALHR
ncbi:MAG: methyltransferase domain-containing protein [Acidobacteria bacterium]|nr:methyltransferase domain-containing protein [Acidobacteriota bacterium]